MRASIYHITLSALCCLMVNFAFAQSNLDRRVTVSVKQKQLGDLLTEIGKQGNFYFSYSSEAMHTDSLVTLSANSQPVRDVLNELFNNTVDYKETQGYVILRPAPNHLILTPENTDETENIFIISGYVTDEVSGKKLADASVYEPHLLVSTLTDRNGFFKLKLKASGTIALTVSKEYYRDTTINFLSKVNVQVNGHDYQFGPALANGKTERSWFGRTFLSYKLKAQAVNIGGFISGVPVQTSFVPGLGSHGLMSGQIVNNFSLNVLGGYSAGVNGVEVGGLFNLNKQDAKYVQVGGLFNTVGGDFSGSQTAGLVNVVYKNFNGVQVGGLFNRVSDTVRGLQVGGIMNTARTVSGLQVGGIVNHVNNKVNGAQVAGIANIVGSTANGFQIAGVLNKARVLNGVHIAPVNIADTLNGCAIGLLTIAKNGYHQVGVYTDENYTTQAFFKTGNKALYTKLLGGINFTNADTYYSYGLGLGHEFEIGKQSILATEIGSELLSSPAWHNLHQLHRVSILVDLPISGKARVFFGPSVNLYDQEHNNTAAEQSAVVKNQIALTGIGRNFKMWAGWTVGFSMF